MHTHPQIVIGFDGGEDGLQALRWARGFAALTPGTVLHLTHALALPAVPRHSFHLTVEEILAAAERQIRVQLDAARDELAQAGIAAEIHVRHWLPADTLLEQAEALDAALIVVGQQAGGAQRTQRAQRILIGSTSGAVSREAGMPVVVVRGAERPSPPRRILVGADGSGGSRAALLAASQLFPDARLLLASVREADRVLDSADLAALASSAGIDSGRVELHSLQGDTAATLLALAASSEVDLLCAGRLGASPLRDLLLGSVSEKLLQLSPCPLLLAH